MSEGPRHLQGLDTLRAAAILMVIARHASEILRAPIPKAPRNRLLARRRQGRAAAVPSEAVA